MCFYCDQHTAFKHGQCLVTRKELCKNKQDPFFIFFFYFCIKKGKDGHAKPKWWSTDKSEHWGFSLGAIHSKLLPWQSYSSPSLLWGGTLQAASPSAQSQLFEVSLNSFTIPSAHFTAGWQQLKPATVAATLNTVHRKKGAKSLFANNCR